MHRGGRCCVTWGSCSLFPPSFAAKVHQFFPSFPRDASSFSTKTTVLWTCARLFAGTRRWLQDATRVGTATNDLLFPSGKAEQRVMERWSRVVACPPCLGSRGMWQCRCLALESASCTEQGSSAPHPHWGCARLIKEVQSPQVYPGSQAGAADAPPAIGAGRAHLCGSGLRGIHSALGFRHPKTSKFRSAPAIRELFAKRSLGVPETQAWLGTSDGVPTGSRGSHDSCWLAFPFLSQTYCSETPAHRGPHLPPGVLPAELGRAWPCRAASQSPACSSGSGWRCG